MGLYDREYVRQESSGNWFTDQPAVIQIVLVNLAVFVVDLLFFEGGLWQWLALRTDLVFEPWKFWQPVTYGFLHDTGRNWFGHIAFNMYMLWMFGSAVEERRGRSEFLRLYLLAIVFSGLAWLGLHWLVYGSSPSSLIGASGAVTCIMVVFVMYYPRRTILLMLVLPVPAWLLGVLYVGIDIMGFSSSVRGMGSGVAYEAHLAGALLGLLYVRRGWNLSAWSFNFRGVGNLRRMVSGTQLRVHKPGDDADAELVEEPLGKRVDRILEKISQQGESSLTAEERRTLEEASRRYQRRRQ